MTKNATRQRLTSACLITAALAVIVGAVPVTRKRGAPACSDPMTECKNAHFIGKTGECTCFSCESPDKDHLKSICTSDPKDKLALFENEASKRKVELNLNKFLPEWRNNVAATLGARPE